MEVNGAILLWSLLPIHDLAGPVVPLHTTRRHVDYLTVQQIGRSVGHFERANITREIPRADDRAPERCGHGTALEHLHLSPAQYAVGEAWAVNLAVVLAVELCPARTAAKGAEHQRGLVSADARDRGFCVGLGRI